ncbi:MAG: YggS family pyridoxal phosphate-dependent enzyme, partial [Bacteroidetes bacterium]|nr:YggS family pyridoxal phosphate-dependent enzyme [Candidatus Cryptobacteroides faecipullorum]
GRHPNLHDGFGLLSFGMTHDYKIAVSMGADIVRIGTLIFGERNYV